MNIKQIINADRANWARDTLEAYGRIRDADNDDIDSNICDLLTDLRHYLATCSGDFTRTLDDAVVMSRIHFNEEVQS